MNLFSSQINTRHSLRLKAYNYSTAGAYFITMCTKNRECLFGQINVGAGPCACPPVVMSDAGRMVTNVWRQIPDYYPSIVVDEFVLMPNHIHGIIIIADVGYIESPELPSGRPQGVAPTRLSLPDVIQRFKNLTTKRYADGVKLSGWQPFDGRLWQRGYYEHVIRNDKELNDVRQYIIDNPLNWTLDEEHPEFVRF
jgi:REP element-mobilizing transposase RayT